MPDDVVGQPFPNGEGPDNQDRGAADEAFASVVLDEDFVEAAAIHEPSAAERILYAALDRAESEAAEPPYYPEPDLADMASGHPEGIPGYGLDGEMEIGEDPDDEEGRFDRSDYTRYLPDEDDEEELGYGGAYTPYGAPGSYAARSASFPRPRAPDGSGVWRLARWQRPVACVLAMVMGISMIALALIAVARAGSTERGDPTPGPASPAVAPGEQPPVVVEADPSEDDL